MGGVVVVVCVVDPYTYHIISRLGAFYYCWTIMRFITLSLFLEERSAKTRAHDVHEHCIRSFHYHADSRLETSQVRKHRPHLFRKEHDAKRLYGASASTAEVGRGGRAERGGAGGRFHARTNMVLPHEHSLSSR